MGAIVVLALEMCMVLLIGRAIFSWIHIGRDNRLYALSCFFHDSTEPVLRPIRRRMPRTGPIDLSLTVVMLLIGFVLIPIASRL
jgi:YggT family protein